MEPIFTKKPPSESKVAKLKQNMIDTCDLIENFWLKDKKYICGDHITIADLLATTELEQPSIKTSYFYFFSAGS
jgi:glutathione S-transferase